MLSMAANNPEGTPCRTNLIQELQKPREPIVES